jgi:hypothetical protein
MRIEQIFPGTVLWSALVCSAIILLAQAPSHAQEVRLIEGSISVRALADRQRRLEEAEFLNRLNPGSPPLITQGLNFSVPPQNGAAATEGQPPAVQNLPPIGLEASGAKADTGYLPNTVLSVYGPEGELTAEVSQLKGKIEKYRVGDSWAGYQIISISLDGVAVSRGGRTRTVAVGGRL